RYPTGPRRCTSPAYGAASPASTFKVVVLPAPLRPTSPIRSPGAIRRLVSESRIRLPARSSRPVAVIMTGVLALWIGRLTGAGKDAGRPVGPVGAGQVSLRNAARRRVYLVAQIDVVRVSGRPAVAQVWGFCLSRAPLLTLK